MQKFLTDLGALMQSHEGQVTGTFDLTFPKADPYNGGDLHVILTYPDWSKIGSIPATR
jgi:hypothetical protein